MTDKYSYKTYPFFQVWVESGFYSVEELETLLFDAKERRIALDWLNKRSMKQSPQGWGHHDGSSQTKEEEAALNRAEGEGMIRAKFPPEYK